MAWIDNEWKVARSLSKGQCKTMLPPYNGAGAADGPFLFNLVSDPTESHDLSKVSQRAATARSHHCSFAHELRSMSNTRCINNNA